ncbi:alpha/beta fold hydrolase [Erythrobacteraceae bacterium WH01K]|nr:alpha/beta fold hydrolase [Erythrobacteraceae bacterium WH01K]
MPRPSIPFRGAASGVGGEIARRVGLAREPWPEDSRTPDWKLLVGELSALAEPVKRVVKAPSTRIALPPTRTRRTVILLPGFATHPVRMRYFARVLEGAGHTVKRWGQGFNWGVSSERFEAAELRLLDVCQRTGEPVVLVGWSLGGLFARELAKRNPDAVAKVITMGTPFSGSPRDNNAWRAYQLVAGHSVDSPPIEADVPAKPPVPTIALWSPRDGIVHHRAAAGRPGERDRAIALRCTHIGFSYAPESIAAVARELEAD